MHSVLAFGIRHFHISLQWYLASSLKLRNEHCTRLSILTSSRFVCLLTKGCLVLLYIHYLAHGGWFGRETSKIRELFGGMKCVVDAQL
jgi:hypothetical protein